MEGIYNYTDYRAWIKDAVEDAKKHKPIVSWRYVASKINIDPGNLLRIAQGKVHLGTDFIEPLADFFHLLGREREYFFEMAFFGRARTDKEALTHFDRMQAIKGVRLRNLEERQLEFYRRWHHNAIRSLVSIFKISDNYRLLGNLCSPHISAAEAKASVEFMQELGMLARDADGNWKVTELFVSSGPKWKGMAVRAFQRETMELAMESLERHHPDLRDISTVTMTLNRAELPALKDRIREFRAELLRHSSEGTGDDAVFQLNVQLFPVGLVDWKTIDADQTDHPARKGVRHA